MLHLFIEILTHPFSCRIGVPHEKTFHVKVAVLEALRRVAVQDEVTVICASDVANAVE